MEIRVMKGDVEICRRAKKAQSFFSRFMGLMFSESLSPYDGLLISPSNSIHTFFMKYPLDVIFLTKDLKIVRIIRGMKPYRMTSIVWGAYQVLEMEAESFPKDINTGDQLEVVCIS